MRALVGDRVTEEPGTAGYSRDIDHDMTVFLCGQLRMACTGQSLK
jgi:hypothetical protein